MIFVDAYDGLVYGTNNTGYAQLDLVTISGEVHGNVYGGVTTGTGSTGSAEDNHVTIDGGTVYAGSDGISWWCYL